jgi:hypothetical protein
MGKRKGGTSSESSSDDDMPVALSMCADLSRVERFQSRLTLMFFATLRLRLPLYVWCPSHSAPGVDAEYAVGIPERPQKRAQGQETQAPQASQKVTSSSLSNAPFFW